MNAWQRYDFRRTPSEKRKIIVDRLYALKTNFNKSTFAIPTDTADDKGVKLSLRKKMSNVRSSKNVKNSNKHSQILNIYNTKQNGSIQNCSAFTSAEQSRPPRKILVSQFIRRPDRHPLEEKETTTIGGREVHKSKCGKELIKCHPYLALIADPSYHGFEPESLKNKPTVPLSLTMVNTHGYPTTEGKTSKSTTDVIMKTDPETAYSIRIPTMTLTPPNPAPHFVSQKPSSLYVTNIIQPGISHTTMQPLYNGQKLYYEPRFTTFMANCDNIDTDAAARFQLHIKV